MATYPDPADFATDETGRLIASNKVEGTAVYNREGERLGSVYNSMVDKVSGQVAYAVMSLGGFLGIGDGYHPLPWKSLTYDTSMGGCVVDLDRSRLEGSQLQVLGRIATMAGVSMTITASLILNEEDWQQPRSGCRH